MALPLLQDHVRRTPWQVGETPHDHAEAYPGGPIADGRSKAAKQKGLKGKADPMMKAANKVKGDLLKWVKQDEKAKGWALVHGLIISFVSIACFITMLLMWFLVYRKSFGWSIAMIVLCFIVAAGLCIYGARKREQRLWIIVMGLMCFLVTVIGVIFGFFLYYKLLVYYQRYLEMREYTNVGGSQNAQQFPDASMFLFTQDTRLDVMRSVGFKSRWTGETYCVAPVVDSTMDNSNPINYWSIGENCCLARGEFVCEDAQDAQTMSALVVLEPEDVVRPFMRWAVAGSVYPRYVRAIHLEESAYGTRAARDTKLLYWVKDPIAKQNSFYYKAKSIATWFTVILWIVLFMVGYAICFKFRQTKERKDKRLQNNVDTTKQQTYGAGAAGAAI